MSLMVSDAWRGKNPAQSKVNFQRWQFENSCELMPALCCVLRHQRMYINGNLLYWHRLANWGRLPCNKLFALVSWDISACKSCCFEAGYISVHWPVLVYLLVLVYSFHRWGIFMLCYFYFCRARMDRPWNYLTWSQWGTSGTPVFLFISFQYRASFLISLISYPV